MFFFVFFVKGGGVVEWNGVGGVVAFWLVVMIVAVAGVVGDGKTEWF